MNRPKRSSNVCPGDEDYVAGMGCSSPEADEEHGKMRGRSPAEGA
jgi:hypothetical protein